MRYIETLYDNSLNQNYKLYQMNIRALSDRLKKQYRLSPLKLQVFNSESKLLDTLCRIKNMKSRGHNEETIRYFHADYRQILRDAKEYKHISTMKKRGTYLGMELMPIAISANGDIESEDTKLELLDGFKRLFSMNKEDIPDINVLVKVYDVLDDKTWINAMMLYNSWKFSSGEGAKKYIDRGFQLGLYYRYKIDFIEMADYDTSMYRALNTYTCGNALSIYGEGRTNTSGIYETFWDNGVFYNDIQAISTILKSRPIFRVKKKGEIIEYQTGEKKSEEIGLSRLLKLFISLLGEVRKVEFEKGIQDRKFFDIAILEDYFADESLQKQFMKLMNMSVDGFIVNHINNHMKEGIKKRVYEGMGLEYVPPAPKKVENSRSVNINDLKF